MLILGILLTVTGLLLLFAFLSARIRCRTKTEAVVIKVIEKKRYYRGRTVYDCTPEFSYTVNGREYTAKADRSSSDPKKYSVGQRLTVFTDADHPENVRYGSGAGFCAAGLVLTALGAFTIVLFFI